MRYYTVHFVFDFTTVVSCIEILGREYSRELIIATAINSVWNDLGLTDELLLSANGIDIEEG